VTDPTPAPRDTEKRRRLRRPNLDAQLALRSILASAAVAVPPGAVIFARVAGAGWPASFLFGVVAAIAVYLASRERTTEEKAADLGRGVVVSLVLTLALAWIQHQGETRSTRESLAFSLSSGDSFVGIDLHGRDMKRFYLAQKKFDRADLEDATLEGAVMNGASLRGTNLHDADLSDADLQEADLGGGRTDLSDAKLTGADLTLAKLGEARLSGADLRDADLAGAHLHGADLRDADLRGASLLGADLRFAILSGDLRGAVFAADFRPARLEQAVLAHATWDATTSWPAGFDPEAAVAAAAKPVASPPVPAAAKSDRVSRVGDGDTIVLERLGVVRLLGIDAPQTDTRRPECFANAATADARELLSAGRNVRVRLGAPARDAFGRALAYVWTDDGALANQQLLAQGDARVLIVSPNDRYEQSLRLAQARAAGARRGLWATC
jgi:uncharacterized protein YjbI with pentapeptide repeats